MTARKFHLLFGALLASSLSVAAPVGDRASQQLARELMAEMVAINTAPSGGPGQTKKLTDAMAARLVAAGFPADDVRVLGLAPGDGNLVARWRSPAPKDRPILLMAHIDVVEALPSEWDTNPFELVEKDGYYYGRGTRDVKGGAAWLLANFIRLRAEGFVPQRDLIILLTADEETSGANSRWLLSEHRPLVDAAFALNTDAGQVDVVDGKALSFMLQTAEKTYATWLLETRSPGGHSSRPGADNAIYKLAAALRAIEMQRFPADLNDTTRTYFKRWADIAPPEARTAARLLGAGTVDGPQIAALAQSPYVNALLRTTCVATKLDAGDSENSLPQRARAWVNCRILPQTPVATVEAKLRDLVGRDVTVTPTAPVLAGPASPLDPAIVEPITAVAREIWPGILVLPEMGTGATDGLYFRSAGIPVYGTEAVAEAPDDDRSHAANERVPIDSYNKALEFWYRLTKRLAE